MELLIGVSDLCCCVKQLGRLRWYEAEHTAFVHPVLVQLLPVLFTSILNHSYVPAGFCYVIIIPLIKDKAQVIAWTVVIVELLWPPYEIGQSIIFLPCGFFLSSSSFFFSSPNLSGCRLDVYHTSTHGVDLVRIECRSETWCTRLAANAGRNNRQKFAVWAPLHNFVGLYLCN